MTLLNKKTWYGLSLDSIRSMIFRNTTIIQSAVMLVLFIKTPFARITRLTSSSLDPPCSEEDYWTR